MAPGLFRCALYRERYVWWRFWRLSAVFILRLQAEITPRSVFALCFVLITFNTPCWYKIHSVTLRGMFHRDDLPPMARQIYS